jgi:hypothetical protein
MKRSFNHNSKLVVFLMVCCILALSLSCSLSGGSNSTVETQIAIGIQQTSVAKEIQELTRAAEQAPAEDSGGSNVEPTEPQAPTNPPPPTDPPAPTNTPQPVATATPSKPSFEEWMKTANIVLFEDVYGTTEHAMIRDALQNLSLRYTKSDADISVFISWLNSSTTWDLVIYAREDRYYTTDNVDKFINENYRKGSSVIVEFWNLDYDYYQYRSTVSLLQDCGVSHQRDWEAKTNNEQVLHAQNTENPIHYQPNTNIRLNSPQNVWVGDRGDLLQTISGGDAEILFSIVETYDQTHGTVVACHDNRMVIQTHATHNYSYPRMIKLWENYIYNTLLARYEMIYGN